MTSLFTCTYLLQAEAAAAGGALHVLNGNHETMNVGGNHRSVPVSV